MHCTINNVAPSQVTTIHYLGVLISSDLSWSAHVDFTNRKAAKMLDFFKAKLSEMFEKAKSNITQCLYKVNLGCACCVGFAGKGLDRALEKDAKSLCENCFK